MASTKPRTLDELQKLISDSKGEWEQIKFKKTTGELHGGMVTLCGFLNGTGSQVFFGVTNAGKVIGQEMTAPTFQEVANAILKLEPPAWIAQSWHVRDILAKLSDNPAPRTLRDDLQLLKRVGLVEIEGEVRGCSLVAQNRRVFLRKAEERR